MSRLQVSVTCLSFVLLGLTYIQAFNIDIVHPIIYEDPDSKPDSESYFGYTVQYLFTPVEGEESFQRWILVGAPRANSTYLPKHANITEPGRLYRCSLGAKEGDLCKQVLVDPTRDEKQGEYPVVYKDRKEFGWVGGALAVQHPKQGRVAVCGHRWANKIFRSSELMNGVCYFSEHNVSIDSKFEKRAPLVRHDYQAFTPPGSTSGSFYYSFGQAGISVHFSSRPLDNQQEVIVGAPGIYNWAGGVIRFRDFEDGREIPNRFKRQASYNMFATTLVPNPYYTTQLHFYEYFGYSVSSGVFTTRGPLLYVASAPRAADMKGKVFIFNFPETETGPLKIFVEKQGTQVGEYFGASVLVTDLNNDGLDDLLVGAPLHSVVNEAVSKTGDEGRVYVFMNQGNSILQEVSETVYMGSKARGARFGTTMAAIGDVSNDDFVDIVVGAPYENEGRGAIYLYLGRNTGLSPRFSQRISPEQISPLVPLRGFGIYMAGYDIDDNKYPDLLVGSYASGHAVILRSQPLIAYRLQLTSNPTKINPTTGAFEVTACTGYKAKFEPATICSEITIQMDVQYAIPRVVLEYAGVNSTKVKYLSVMELGKTTCQTFKGYVLSSALDFSRSVLMRLSAELRDNPVFSPNEGVKKCPVLRTERPGSKAIYVKAERLQGANQDEFCAKCPVVDKREPNSTEYSVAFLSGCGEDDRCVADLDLQYYYSGMSDKDKFIIGSEKTLKLVATLSNYGEPAFLAAIHFQIPTFVPFLRLPKQCEENVDEKATIADTQTYTLRCMLANPLRIGKSEKIELDLDVTLLPSGLESLNIRMEASTTSDLKEVSPYTSTVNSQLPLSTVVDVSIAGVSVREQQNYDRPNETYAGSTLVPFSHRYEVVKLQPSPLKLVEIELMMPINLTSKGVVTTFVELYNATAYQDSQPIICKGTFTRNPVNPEDDESKFGDTTLDDTTEKRKKRRVYEETDTLYQRPAHVIVKRDTVTTASKRGLTTTTAVAGDATVAANRTSLFDCSMPEIACTKVICPAGPMYSNTRVTITLNAAVNIQALLPYLGNKDVIAVSSEAIVTIIEPRNAQQPINHKPDEAVATSYFMPHGSLAEEQVAIWVIAVAIGAGLLILLLVVLLLCKCGFFKRKKYGELATGEGNDGKQYPTPEEEEEETG